jgi:UDP-glucose 4-epimerase
MTTRRILVTGGAGFVGSHLVEALLDSDPNLEVVIADNFFLGHEENLNVLTSSERCIIERVDVSSQSALFSIISKFNIKTVWNLAVVPLPTSLIYPEWTIQNNINCALAICEASRFFAGLRVVNISSSEAYGTAIDVPMSEDHLFSPETPYAASKAAADLIFNSYNSTFGINYLTLRPFNMFGPRQNQGSYAGVVPIFIDKISKSEAVTIYGNGNQTRDFVFVKDSVQAMLEAENHWNGESSITLNIASGVETSVNSLLNMLTECMEAKPAKIEFLPIRDGDVLRHCGDSSKYTALTGKKIPEISMDSLRETIAWYTSNVR